MKKKEDNFWALVNDAQDVCECADFMVALISCAEELIICTKRMHGGIKNTYEIDFVEHLKKVIDEMEVKRREENRAIVRKIKRYKRYGFEYSEQGICATASATYKS